MVTGELVSLRPFDRSHLEQTRLWVNDPETSRLLGRARPVSDWEHEQWFNGLRDRLDEVHFAVHARRDDRHVGNVWLWGIDWRHQKGEVRVLIGESDARSRGLGTEAIGLLCAYAFERLNLHRMYAFVLAMNPRALRAFEKAGFAVEGVLKEDRWDGSRFWDVYLVGRLR
jgi:RimJ/RimL family protein N-acetyltransferase